MNLSAYSKGQGCGMRLLGIDENNSEKRLAATMGYSRKENVVQRGCYQIIWEIIVFIKFLL